MTHLLPSGNRFVKLLTGERICLPQRFPSPNLVKLTPYVHLFQLQQVHDFGWFHQLQLCHAPTIPWNFLSGGHFCTHLFWVPFFPPTGFHFTERITMRHQIWSPPVGSVGKWLATKAPWKNPGLWEKQVLVAHHPAFLFREVLAVSSVY